MLSDGLKHLGGAQIYLKREDLNHTGSHKVNNTIGQALLAKLSGKNESLLKQVQVNMVLRPQPSRAFGYGMRGVHGC